MSFSQTEWTVPPYSDGVRKVLLSDVDALTLRSGRYTTGRRSSPIPQISCVGGSAGCSYIPSVIQCENKGSDGVDAQWECKAEMDSGYSFGETNVACEGYDYPDDPYILAGSCGVDFTLDRTRNGGSRQIHSESNFFGSAIVILLMVVCLSLCCDPGGGRYRSGGGEFLAGAGTGYLAGSFLGGSRRHRGYGGGWGGRSRSSTSRTSRGFGTTRRR